MKKGVEYRGIVKEIKFPNKGIVDCGEDGEAIVKNVIPGQKVRFMVNKKRAGRCMGRLLEVEEKSELEDALWVCPHFGECGGCSYQSMSYENQLELKKNQVKEIIDEVVSSNYQFEGIIGSPNQWEYRNKMEYTFGDEFKDGPLALGMHKKGSFHDIVTVDGCRITNKDYNLILTTVLHFFQKRNMPFYHKVRHDGYLRHLLVRRTSKTQELLVGLVTTSDATYEAKAEIDKLVEELKNLELSATLKGIVHIINDDIADVIKCNEMRILLGEDFIYEELFDLKFKISVFSFFQTNSLGAEVLYSKAREYVGDTKDKLVFDLYSGTGTIAQMMADVAKKVVGVEIVEDAVEAAKVNAKLNGLDNCEFIAGDVLKVIDDIEDKPDLIILDPPRDGINPKALTKIINYNVDKLVYISCKPTSLARDLVVLQENGYKVEKVCAVDMFPNTVHVETVVLLSQRKADDYLEVEIDLDELDATSAETKATYEEIKKYVVEHNDGMKVSNLYIAQVKKKCGIEIGQNFNLPKSENAKQPQCPKEKEDAIVEALKAFQMI